jgi:hypothetical protein
MISAPSSADGPSRLLPDASGLVATTQDDRFARRVEGERESPDTIGRVEPQLFHVRVARSRQRIDARSSHLRSEDLQCVDMREQLILNVLVQRLELRHEQAMEVFAAWSGLGGSFRSLASPRQLRTLRLVSALGATRPLGHLSFDDRLKSILLRLRQPGQERWHAQVLVLA